MTQTRTPAASALRSRAALLLIALTFTACSEERTVPNYARLNRSNAVDFVCAHDGKPVALSMCEAAIDPATGARSAGWQLFAFVSQSARGEIATIDLGRRELLDSRPDIPGYTFVPAGEGPIAIVVPPNHPEFTYVANFGSHDIYVFATQDLIPPAISSEPLRRFPLAIDGPQGRSPAAPTHMVLDPGPNEDALLVAVPDQGRVLRVPIRRTCETGALDCTPGLIDEAAVTSIALQESLMRAPANTPPPSAGAYYEQMCKYVPARPPAAAPIQQPPIPMGAAPHPRSLAVDASCREGEVDCRRRLLVADDALPLIHVIDLDAFASGADPAAALLDPIAVGVPTRELAVTPRVPVALGSEQETHYIYAIDATDGSVLVVEGSQVLNVDAFGDRPSRIELPNTDGRGSPVASALAVLTPGFKADIPSYEQYLTRPDKVPPMSQDIPPLCAQPDRPIQNPLLLRGVFVAVALSDGKVRLIDVHDLTMRSPDGVLANACRLCKDTGQPYPLLSRHHLRLTDNPEELPQPDLTPYTDVFAFQSEGSLFPVRVDGSSGAPGAPSMSCIPCGESMRPTFPRREASAADGGTAPEPQGQCSTDPNALLCAVTDPWSRLEEQWGAVYEGPIPGAQGGGARFSAVGEPGNLGGQLELHANLDFCAAGVLGNEDILTAYAADRCGEAAKPLPPSADAGVTGLPRDAGPGSDAGVPADGGASDGGASDGGASDGGTASDDAIVGDQVTITSPLLDSQGPECAAARRALLDAPTQTISFAVQQAYRDHLVIASTPHYAEDPPEALTALTSYSQVRHCTGGGPLSFSVRTRKAFTVEGSQSGFKHSVKADPSTGRCAIDSAATRVQHGRARIGCIFDNGAIAFRMGADRPEPEPTPGVQWNLRLRSPAQRAFFDGNSLGISQARVLAVQLRFLDVTDELFVVDIHERGLVPVPAGNYAFPQVIDSALTVQ